MRRGSALMATAIGVVVGPLIATATASADTSYNARINQGNVPATAAGYTQDCNSDEFGNKQPSQDGWLFVASPSNFTAFEAIFKEGTVVLGSGSNPDGTSLSFTKADDHLAVLTPGGWTLTDAYANLDGNKDFFTLSHTCAASQSTQTTQSTANGNSGSQQSSCSDENNSNGSQSSDCDQNNGGQQNTSGQSASGGDNNSSEHNGNAVGENNGNGNGDSSSSGGQQNNAGNDQDTNGAQVSNSSTSSGTSTNVAPATVSGSQTSAGVQSGQTTSGTSTSGGIAAPAGTTSPALQGTHVLGEKVTKPVATQGSAAGGAAVAGTSAARATALPFTGFITAHLLQAAAALVSAGLVLMVFGRRRRRT